jgi:hypothetical protein
VRYRHLVCAHIRSARATNMGGKERSSSLSDVEEEVEERESGRTCCRSHCSESQAQAGRLSVRCWRTEAG